ncbi:hypothetical protein B9Z55_010039 [Caenorhabditis nigoni]|uniref:Uncharacterized protein n=1 Tax=Caenorhabditis nigoni TaxID=1611254 RepID=A0A2G5UEF0_9PELO|nr:hypothetical protein B9Z55_010039 [Caenorhabditis nigoni]
MREIEKFFTENDPNSEVILQKVISLGIDFLGEQWKNTDENQVNVKKILGGQSNHIFYVTSSNSAKEYLLRIHRQGDAHVFTDTVLFSIFSERGIGPKLYGFFDGGRLEEYIPSRTLDAVSVLEPEISLKIGASFPKYHSMNVPLSKNRRCFQVMRDVLQQYQNLGGGDFQLFPTHVTWTDHPDSITVENLQKEIDLMESWANEIFEDTVVFCHNDLACANILELNSNKDLLFIDWEFASYNCRGFDLAMFLSETAIARGLTSTKAQINQEMTENSPNLYGLCEAYVDSDYKLKNLEPSNRSAEISKLMKECKFFTPITHIFWACFLLKIGLINYIPGADINVRARDRLAVYFHLKSRSQKIYEEFK